MGAPAVLGGPNAVPEAGLLFPLVARTATPGTPTNGFVGEFGPSPSAVGVGILIDTTASAAPTTVFNVEFYEPETATWLLLLASAAVVANGQVTLTVDPRIATAANVSIQTGLRPRMRVRPVHGNGNSHTYAVTVYAWS
jgi:hypothetical protein